MKWIYYERWKITAILSQVSSELMKGDLQEGKIVIEGS